MTQCYSIPKVVLWSCLLILLLYFSFLQYISAELCLSEGDDNLGAPTKEQLEQEKQLLLSFKPVMQKFLHDHTDLQVSALYALQVHCNTYAFPKGKPLTFFYNCYNFSTFYKGFRNSYNLCALSCLLLFRHVASILCSLL